MGNTVKEIVAKAVRLEHDHQTGQVFLVFEIIDERFKQRVKQNWLEDIELELVENKD